jgi:6-phosphofructokinase
MIRSVPANASDALYCMLLAQNAVHGAMAGYTGFSVGLVNNRVVYIPIPRLVATSPRVMDPMGKNYCISVISVILTDVLINKYRKQHICIYVYVHIQVVRG